MDCSAPLPALLDQKPTWDKAAALARDWTLYKLAERLDGLADCKFLRGQRPDLKSSNNRLRRPVTAAGGQGQKVARWLARFHRLNSVHDQRGWDALIAINYSIQKPKAPPS
jgi:hypothetical protein